MNEKLSGAVSGANLVPGSVVLTHGDGNVEVLRGVDREGVAHSALLSDPAQRFGVAVATANMGVAQVRFWMRVKLRRAGYSRKQANRLAAAPGTNTILERLKAAWERYGPIVIAIFKVALFFLSMAMQAEPPEGPPLEGDAAAAALDEEEAGVEAEVADSAPAG